MDQYIDKTNVLQLANDAEELHPYAKDPKRPETYSAYNEGWTDACRYIQGQLERIPVTAPEQWVKVDASYWRWKPDGAHMVQRIRYKHAKCGRVVNKPEAYCPQCGLKMEEKL